MPQNKIFKFINSTPTIAAAAYSSGDQIGSLNTLSDFVNDDNGTAKIITLSLIDKAKQKSALDILFFTDTVTLASADNDALDISDANMATYFLGMLSVAAADYKDLANSSVACLNNLKLLLQSVPNKATIFYVLRSAGTPTYVSTTDLVFKFGLEQD